MTGDASDALTRDSGKESYNSNRNSRLTNFLVEGDIPKEVCYSFSNGWQDVGTQCVSLCRSVCDLGIHLVTFWKDGSPALGSRLPHVKSAHLEAQLLLKLSFPLSLVKASDVSPVTGHWSPCESRNDSDLLRDIRKSLTIGVKVYNK
jgi:hypothetical protein